MTTSKVIVPFSELIKADLVVDRIYEGGTKNNISDDPLSKLLPGTGNQGGFRIHGSPRKNTVRYAILYTTGNEPDWPDKIDLQTGTFTYYGDNRNHEKELHETDKGGNLLLRDIFEASHNGSQARISIPPLFVFKKARETGRAVKFLGLAAPGGPGLSQDDELQAIWRSKNGNRFQNYRAHFTILDEAVIPRLWITDLASSQPLGNLAPKAWKQWVSARAYSPLIVQPTTAIRTREEQEPTKKEDRDIITAIRGHFANRPHDFESCAIEIWRMIAPATGKCDQTPPSRDGGRDAIGTYLIGPATDPIEVEFALEAKCYKPGNSVGVADTSRLMSRLRNRQFGVFVTTSHFGRQAYTEARNDKHPVSFIAAVDIVHALKANGYSDANTVKNWLQNKFP